MLFLVSLWFLMFSTDVLLLAPEAIAVLFAAARIWDAVIDPLAGYVSDRTRTPLGRRRPYMFAASIALPVVFYWLFNPPAVLDPTTLQTTWRTHVPGAAGHCNAIRVTDLDGDGRKELYVAGSFGLWRFVRPDE